MNRELFTVICILALWGCSWVSKDEAVQDVFQWLAIALTFFLAAWVWFFLPGYWR